MSFALPASIVQSLPAESPSSALGYRPSLADRLQWFAMTALSGTPQGLLRILAGRPIIREGQRLDPQLQLGLRATTLSGEPERTREQLPASRRHTAASAYAISGQRRELPYVRDISLPLQDVDGGNARLIGARYYRPTSDPAPLPLLVYYHGGGWAQGTLDTHDAPCRYLAERANIAVLSVDYRLAPEHPFPAGLEDSFAAFRWAHEHASELGVNADRIAVGGDSAGGNIAAVVCHLARDAHGPTPAMQLLIVPVTEFGSQHQSRETYASGFYLTATDMDYFEDLYLPKGQSPKDPRISPLLATDFSGLPPAYLAVAGFDPLRDEGEAYAARLREAGVRASTRRHNGALHPIINAVEVSPLSRTALDEMVGALRQELWS